jgi:hypothetical protein
MKLEKKHWAMLITGVVVLFLVYWFFFRKKVTESAYNPYVPIWGIGMGSPSESGYSADQLDAMGVESGFSFRRRTKAATQYSPTGYGYVTNPPYISKAGECCKWAPGNASISCVPKPCTLSTS